MPTRQPGPGGPSPSSRELYRAFAEAGFEPLIEVGVGDVLGGDFLRGVRVPLQIGQVGFEGGLVGADIDLEEVAEGGVGHVGVLLWRYRAEPDHARDILDVEAEVRELALDVTAEVVVLVGVIGDELLEGVDSVGEKGPEGHAQVVQLAGGKYGGVVGGPAALALSHVHIPNAVSAGALDKQPLSLVGLDLVGVRAAGELVPIEIHALHDVEIHKAHVSAADAQAGAFLDLKSEFHVVAESAEIDAAKDIGGIDFDVAQQAAAHQALAFFVDEGGRGIACEGAVHPGEDFIDQVLALLADQAGAAAEGLDDVVHLRVGEAAAGEGAVAHLGVALAGLHEDVLGRLLGGAEAHGVEHALEVLADEVEGRDVRAARPVAGFAALLSLVMVLALAGHRVHWVAFGLLEVVGLHMVVEAVRHWKDGPATSQGASFDPSRGLPLLGLSVATSIDAFGAGMGMRMAGANLWLACPVIGFMAAVLTYVGASLGVRAEQWLGRKAELLGGLVLIGLGVRMLGI